MRLYELAKNLGVKPKLLIKFLEEWFPREDGREWEQYHEVSESLINLINEYFSPDEYERNNFDVDTFSAYIEEVLDKFSYPYNYIKRQGKSRIIVELVDKNGNILQINVSAKGFLLETKDEMAWKELYERIKPYKNKLKEAGFYLIPREKLKPSKLGTYGLFYLHDNSDLYAKIFESKDELSIREGIKEVVNHIYKILIIANVICEPEERFILQSFSVENFRRLRFKEQVIFDKANVIVGENDSGKTSLLLALLFYLKAIKLLAKNIEDINKIKGEYGLYISEDFFFSYKWVGHTQHC